MSETTPIGNEVERPLLENNGEPEYGTASSTPAQGTFKKNLGTINAFAIVISIVIGSGVFTSPGSIDANVPSPGLALITWLVGGVLVRPSTFFAKVLYSHVHRLGPEQALSPNLELQFQAREGSSHI